MHLQVNLGIFRLSYMWWSVRHNKYLFVYKKGLGRNVPCIYENMVLVLSCISIRIHNE